MPTPNRDGCIHDPYGLLKRCSICEERGQPLDENTAYLETAAWLALKSGTMEHTVEAEVKILWEMLLLPDTRTQL